MLKFEKFNKEQLWKLRQECNVGSIYILDYINLFGVDERDLQYFFDGYLENLEELMEQEIPNFKDKDFWKVIKDYDNPHNLYNWFCANDDLSWVKQEPIFELGDKVLWEDEEENPNIKQVFEIVGFEKFRPVPDTRQVVIKNENGEIYKTFDMELKLVE